MPSSPNLLSIALLHHKAGALSKAATLYQEILSSEPRNADALHLLGVLFNQLGNSERAVDLITKGIDANPGATEYHNNLGNALKARGDESAAETSYSHAIALDCCNAQAHTNLGALLEGQGRLEEARICYQRALRFAPNMLQPQLLLGKLAMSSGDYRLSIKHFKAAVRSGSNHAPAHNALGNAFFAAGQNKLAKTSYVRARELDPAFLDPVFNLGNVHLAEANYTTALEYYEQSIPLSAPAADIHNNMGIAYLESGQLEAASKSLLRAIELDTSYAEAHFNLGRVLAKRKAHRRAIESFEKALALKPEYSKALHGLGASRQALGELKDAEEVYRQARSLDSENTDIWNNLGYVLAMLGSREGILCLEQLVQEQPMSAKAHCSLSAALLVHGDYIRGWREHEWRWELETFTSPKRGFEQPQWQGELLHDVPILLHAEQGFGDTLQFVRYASLVAQRGGQVILEVQPALKRLLQNVPGVTECIGKGDPLPEFSCHCPLMSLPFVFATTLETIPSFSLDALEEVAAESLSLGVNEEWLNVGIVWAGNPEHENDALRSMSLTHFLPLAKVDAVSFVSLQKGSASAQTGGWPSELPDPCATSKDFADTAAIISKLDLVITVDTAIAHLAGAMRKPVWILNSHVPDWRWGLQSETTPWYPTARLFRRSHSGGWEEMMNRVVSELGAFRDAHTQRSFIPRTTYGKGYSDHYVGVG